MTSVPARRTVCPAPPAAPPRERKGSVDATRRMVGDPVLAEGRDREACLYGAAMMRKIGRLPTDMTAIDVTFEPPGTIIFVSADGAQLELGRYVIPDRVLTYEPKVMALPPAEEEPSS